MRCLGNLALHWLQSKRFVHAGACLVNIDASGHDRTRLWAGRVSGHPAYLHRHVFRARLGRVIEWPTRLRSRTGTVVPPTAYNVTWDNSHAHAACMTVQYQVYRPHLKDRSLKVKHDVQHACKAASE